jgi:fatty acid desaturase
MGPYVLLIVGIPASMSWSARAVEARTASTARYGHDAHHAHAQPVDEVDARRARQRPPAHGPRRRDGLERRLALLCFVVWFFAFAGSSLPT